MKYFISIFFTYLIILTAVPCCSFDECPSDEVMTEKSSDDARNDQTDCGTCSPFFQCDRCTVLTEPAQHLCMEPNTFPVDSRYAEYTIPIIPETHSEHWRPPQL